MSLFRTKNIQQMIDQGQQGTHLRKTLGATDLVFLGIGALIGTGIFVLTGTGAQMAGPGLTIAFVIAAMACCLAAFSYAEFASSIPVAGSLYTYSYATLGEGIAWLTGWILLLEYGLAVASVSVGWSGYLQSLLAGIDIHLPTVLSAAPLAIPGVQTWINLPAFLVMMAVTTLLSIGIRESARANNIMVIIKVTVVLLVIGVGAFNVHPVNWQPFLPMGWTGVFGASAIMVFAFLGFDAVSSAAEEVRNPKRDLPIGIIGSLAICALLYVLVAAVMTGMLPFARFEGASHPVSLALQAVGQSWVAGFVDLGAVTGMLTVMLVMAYGQTRIIFAMSRDGLLPARLSVINPRFATPLFATWAVGLVVGTIGALVPLKVLAELVNIGTLMAFSMVSIAVIVMRRTHPHLPRSFRCPGMPYVPLLAVAFCVFLALQLQRFTWIAFGIWLVVGLVVYFAYSRRHSKLAQPSAEASAVGDTSAVNVGMGVDPSV
ncbi:MAG: amino acid permease [Janthinobacterium lividum]